MALIIGVIILAVCLVGWLSLYSYANKKTRLLKEKGYLFVCYFLTKVDKLEYYRNKEQWITALYDATYHEKRHIPKEEILVLSHNRKTADEFQESLMCLD